MKTLHCILLLLLVVSCKKDEKPIEDANPETRSFYMGFTAFPYDASIEANLNTYAGVVANSDIFLNHLDHGVPWDEALNDMPFPSEVQATLEVSKTGLTPSSKILLTATPISQNRKELAGYWNNNGSQQPLSQFWQEKSFDDPDVINAFTKYCMRVIDEVQPDYFAYGIEVNAEFKEGETTFNAYLTLVSQVYPSLKDAYPNLPIFLTFQDQSFDKTHQETLELTSSLLPYSDYIAMSSYPFLYYEDIQRDADPSLFPDNWLADFRSLDPSKPFAIAETGFCAEDLVISNLGINVKGTPEWQEAYMTKLFNQANTLDAEFLAWFIFRDYDMLYDNTPNPPDILKIWRDNGLLDGNGNQRPAYAIWDDWRKMSKD